MEGKNLLDRAAGAMDKVRPVGIGTWLLYVQNGKINIGSWVSCQSCQHKIAKLSSKDINEGPRSAMWNLIQTRLIALHEKGVI